MITLTVIVIAGTAFVFYFRDGAGEKRGEFIGYYGSQPQLKITTLSGQVDANQLEPVIKAAKDFYNSLTIDINDYWPEPADILEQANTWWVKFLYKDKIFLNNGRQEIQSVAPGALLIKVEKQSLKCSLIPLR